MRALQQERDDNEGEASVHDHDAVAQRIEAMHTNKRQRSQHHPSHRRSKEEARQSRKCSDEAAGPQKDDKSGEEGHLSDIEGR